MKSDISGEPLDGSSKPEPIVIEFSDGTRQRLTVSAAEAAKYRGAGTAASHWYSWPRIRTRMRALVYPLAGLWVASIVIPAVVAQWADRTKELELKNNLVTEISESAADVTLTAANIARQRSPEDRATRAASADVKELKEKAGLNPTAAEQKAISAAETALKKAKQAESRADQIVYNAERLRWNRTSASLKARLDTYFTSRVGDDWALYSLIVRDFLRLSTSIAGEDRRRLELNVLAFLAYPDSVNSATPFPNFQVVADRLLDQRKLVLSQVLAGNTEGYSTSKLELVKRVFFFD